MSRYSHRSQEIFYKQPLFQALGKLAAFEPRGPSHLLGGRGRGVRKVQPEQNADEDDNRWPVTPVSARLSIWQEFHKFVPVDLIIQVKKISPDIEKGSFLCACVDLFWWAEDLRESEARFAEIEFNVCYPEILGDGGLVKRFIIKLMLALSFQVPNWEIFNPSPPAEKLPNPPLNYSQHSVDLKEQHEIIHRASGPTNLSWFS